MRFLRSRRVHATEWSRLGLSSTYKDMKIIIATTINPFVEGGSTYIVDWLEETLKRRGHEVEAFRFPFSDDPSEILEQLVALRLTDLSNHGDRLITIRTPSHLLRHPHKITWFIHHYRGAYDLWGTKYQTIPNTPEGDSCRQAIIAADNVGLREAAKVFCNSKVVQRRLKVFNNIEAEVLYPPLLRPDLYHCAEYGDFFLYFSRLTHHKRQWLAIESLKHSRTAVKLVIAGPTEPSCEPYVEELRRLIQKNKLTNRVILLPKWVPEVEKIDLFARCLGTLYFPFDEDSYGYPSLESHCAKKAVLTTTDAGGTVELITDDYNGKVIPADPQLIAETMDDLFLNRSKARQLGENGLERMNDLGIGWDNVLRRLLA